jgi:hypothetical protein
MAPTLQNPSCRRSKPTTIVQLVATCRLEAVGGQHSATSARAQATRELGGGGGGQRDGKKYLHAIVLALMMFGTFGSEKAAFCSYRRSTFLMDASIISAFSFDWWGKVLDESE